MKKIWRGQKYETNSDLNFLAGLEQKDRETPTAVIRDRIDQEKKFLSPQG